ncbi:hypothetical protein KV205_15280 [Streptomyces sp. SKN60]|uniref:hypothetical protein n=1 Tax=Streptomyces sp. SKN60 TaxID=2855506 RepID=UPI0022452B40|nr:hypothetical protein [Streptomyces sp. SKN60]MCX2181886.1 hypothetical protein [Streptomyces sp. SKN60]
MYETGTSRDAVGWYRRIRRADTPVAVLVGLMNVLLCGMLFMMVMASGITFGAPDATQQAEMDAAGRLAEQLYLGWLAGGLLLFGLFRLPRTAVAHLLCMLVPPAVLVAYLAAAG